MLEYIISGTVLAKETRRIATRGGDTNVIIGFPNKSSKKINFFFSKDYVETKKKKTE